MHILVFAVWVVSLVLLAIATFMPRPFNMFAGGVLAFDLWIGLQFLVDTADRITI